MGFENLTYKGEPVVRDGFKAETTMIIYICEDEAELEEMRRAFPDKVFALEKYLPASEILHFENDNWQDFSDDAEVNQKPR